LLVEVGETDYQQAAPRLVELYNGIGEGRLARHLHLSLQSGSNKVLKKMNRNYTTKEFREVVNIVRRGISGINITTDIIVGFPGETDKDFKQTLNFVKEMKFGKLHVFRYSARKGTLAAEKEKQWGEIDSKTKKKRSKKIRQLGKKLKKDFYHKQIGTEAIAKVWGEGDGLTDNYIPIKLDLSKKIAEAEINKVKLDEFKGKFIKASSI
jgi:threonylcarbamoyladenosine tRNA methylthiotransferase MtaB